MKIPSPSNRSVEPNTGPGVARSFVIQIAIPSPWRLPAPCIWKVTSICEDGQYLVAPDWGILGGIKTIQLVAVNGRRENSHPSCEGRSDVRRIYLYRKSETWPSHRTVGSRTGLLALLCLVQTRNTYFAYLNVGMAVSYQSLAVVNTSRRGSPKIMEFPFFFQDKEV